MKKIFLLIFFVTAVQLANAQLISWKAKLGNSKSWSFKGEDKKKNIVRLKNSQLTTRNNFLLGYKATANEKEWKRTLQIDDSTGAGIIELPEITTTTKDKTGIWYTISAKQLKEILTHHREITIWVSSIPSDPAKAMLVRVRPVYICTLRLD